MPILPQNGSFLREVPAEGEVPSGKGTVFGPQSFDPERIRTGAVTFGTKRRAFGRVYMPGAKRIRPSSGPGSAKPPAARRLVPPPML